MSSADNIERAIAELNLTTRAETDNRILNDAYAALGKAVHKQQPTTDTGIWRMVVRSRFAVPAAIAAMIMLAFALSVNIRTQRAVNIEGIYGALSEVENIHISKFQTGRSSPDQQAWASETLGVKLFKSELGNQAQYTLWDTQNRVKMIKFLSTNSVQTVPITQQMLAELEKTAAGLADIVPFSDRNDIPPDAQWGRIDDREVSAAVPSTKAYDLTWIAKSKDSQVIVHRKWRVFVEDRTNLPKRIEWYAKSRLEDEYGIERFVVIAYPNEAEIQNIILNIFGPRDNRPDDPEYIGTPGAQR
jgi:hypothetical protein